MVRADLLCAVFPRCARKNRTRKKGKYRSAEGAARQLRKSYTYLACACPAQKSFIVLSSILRTVGRHGSQLLVELPAFPHIMLGVAHQRLGAMGVGLLEHAIAGLVIGILLQWYARRLRVENQRISAFLG